MKVLAIALLLVFGKTAQAAPTPEEVAAYRSLVENDLRLAVVSYKLASANAPFCKKKERNPGWVIHDEQQYPERETARAAFGFRYPITVSATVPGGPADMSGIRAGDGLVALNGAAFNIQPESRNTPSAERVESIQKLLRTVMAANDTVQLTLETAEGRKQISLQPPAICASRFWVDARSNLDAGADGDGVRVTDGILAFTSGEDAELAAVVAHELAHNILEHKDWLAQAKRSAKNILVTEKEADRLSVWLMANAGYDPAAALRFAERYGRRTGLGIFSEGTHLRWKNRVKLMQSEIVMIKKVQPQNGLLPPPLLGWGETE